MTTESDFIAGRNRLIGAARIIRSLMIAKGDPMAAHAFADARGIWNDSPEVEGILKKSIVSPVSTNDDLIATWLPLGKKIAEALRPLSVFGRLQPFMRQVPFRTRVVFTTDATEARFVGEAVFSSGSGGTIPVTGLSFSDPAGGINTVNLNLAKLAIIAVHSTDLIRLGPKATDEFIAGELLRSLIKGADRQFIDPSRLYDATRDAPASVTSAGTTLSSAGSTAAAIDSDLGLMVTALVNAEMSLSTAHWVMSPITATYLAGLRGTGDSPAYPRIGARGGELLGLPVITSTACAAEGSPGERYFALVEAGEITYADDGLATIEYSAEADLEMNDAPSGGHQPLRSLWQNGLGAARVQVFRNWQARQGASVVLRNVTY